VQDLEITQVSYSRITSNFLKKVLRFCICVI